MQDPSPAIVIDIDARIATLIEEINTIPTAAASAEFIDGFQALVIEQMLGPFHLTRAMFDDRDGGPVTTLRNFEQGITANDADAERHRAWQEAQSTLFDRTDYDAAMKPRADFTSNVDEYTGREFPQGPRMTARDHVVSGCEIERSSKGHLARSREERVETASQDENMVLTSYNLNSSKAEHDLKEWMARPNADDPDKTNAEVYGIDEKAADAAYQRARDAVDAKQDRAVLEKQALELATESLKGGVKLALRQVLGLLLRDVVSGVIADIRYLVRTGFESLEALADLARRRVMATWEQVRQQWAEYLKHGAGAMLSSFLSNTVTLLVNAFVTTAKNLVRMIREAVLSLVQAVRTIVAPPQGATKQQIAAEVVKILGTAVAACIGLALEEAIAKALQATPLFAPFAADVAPVIAGILSGALSLFAVFAFDKMRERLAFRNKELADVHRGQAVNLLQIKKTFFAIEAAHVQTALAAQALGRKFDETQREIEGERAATKREIAGYRGAVDGLEGLL